MNKIRQILRFLDRNKKNFLLLSLVFALSACDECLTFQNYKNDGIGNNCLLCPLFKILTESAEQVANTAWDAFANGLAQVVLTATMILIAFNTLKMVGSFGKKDFADYMTNDKKGVLILGFRGGVIFLLLTTNFFVDEILIRVLSAGLEIGGKLSTTNVVSWASDAGSWSGLFGMVNNTARAFNDQVYDNIALGDAMICRATEGIILSWHWLMLLYGLLFFVFGWFLLAYISFFMVDIIINLALGALLLPFGIAFAVSGQTMPYAKKIWQIFLGVFFNFVMLGVVLGISVQLIELGMGKMDSDMSPSTGVNSFLGTITALLDQDSVKEASDILWKQGCLLLTIVSFWLASQMIDQVKDLASSISDAIGAKGISSAGTNAAKPFLKEAVNAGKKVGHYAYDTGASGVKYAGHVGARITRLDKGIDALNRKATTLRGKLTGTGREGYKAWWRK